MTRPHADLKAAILARVRVEENDCWIVNTTHNGKGYRWISHDYAHRHMYRLVVGPIPDGYEIDHLCSQPSCANPAHLEAVTHAENMRRAADRRTTCRQGHPWSQSEPGMQRRCAACQARRDERKPKRIKVSLAPLAEVHPLLHGTPTGYRCGCRCDSCRRSARDSQRAHRARRRAAA